MQYRRTHQIIPILRVGGHDPNPGRSRRRTPSKLLLGLVTAALVVASCGHSDAKTEDTGAAADTTTASAPDGTSGAPGTFGDLGRICGPTEGDVQPSDARGVTDDTISIGVLNDAGNTLSPGMGANYVKVAEAFADWCNEAGGINGRKIEIQNRDAKLFDAAAVVLDACESDFMLVGGGAALDEPVTEPRVDCGLGSIPALNISYEGQISDNQAVVGRNSPEESNWGLFRVLEPDYTEAFQKIGIITIDTPDVRGPYEDFAEALESQGLEVTTVQAVSQTLDNVRTYVQPLVGKAETLVLALPVPEMFQAISAVGYEPEVVVDQGGSFYSAAAVGDLKAEPIDAPIYSAATTYPLDRAADNPTAAKLVELEKDAFGTIDQADVIPWITWLLFAQSASQCDVLTVECVITNATADDAYTAGGLLAPVDMTDPAKVTRCFAANTVSADGIAYDEKVTDPDDGVFNCDPANVIPIP